MMITIPNRPHFRLLAPLLCWTFLGGMLGGCDFGPLAGTSVGTGNPQVVTLGFKAGTASAKVSGQVRLYSPDHNPLVDSLPLAAFRVDDRNNLHLHQQDLLPVLSRAGLTADSDCAVNVLVRTADGRGSWLSSLCFSLRSGRLRSLAGPRVDLAMVPLVTFRGTVKVADVGGERRYLTLFGTPYFGRVDAGGFALDSLPQGHYDASLVRYLECIPAEGDVKPSPVHSLNASLDTQVPGALTPTAQPVDTIPLPAQGPRDHP